jgi:hypothetical protein
MGTVGELGAGEVVEHLLYQALGARFGVGDLGDGSDGAEVVVEDEFLDTGLRFVGAGVGVTRTAAVRVGVLGVRQMLEVSAGDEEAMQEAA